MDERINILKKVYKNVYIKIDESNKKIHVSSDNLKSLYQCTENILDYNKYLLKTSFLYTEYALFMTEYIKEFIDR
jgi:propanediol utilization protein